MQEAVECGNDGTDDSDAPCYAYVRTSTCQLVRIRDRRTVDLRRRGALYTCTSHDVCKLVTTSISDSLHLNSTLFSTTLSSCY